MLLKPTNLDIMASTSELLDFKYYAIAFHSAREIELEKFFEWGLMFVLVCSGLHLAFHFVRPESDRGNAFSSAVTTIIFLLNWIGLTMHPEGVHPFSAGMMAGAAAGYEGYATLFEMINLVRGVVRTEMILHHSLCLVFTAITAFKWTMIPSGDVIYWAFVWDSMIIMLASNVALNVRIFCRGTSLWGASSAIFAIHFLIVRVKDQIPFVIDAWNGPVKSMLSSGKLPFEDPLTILLFGSWVVLQFLQVHWAVLVIKMAAKTAGLLGRKKSKPE
jgi:hypothetical protein